jgi:TonB-dependent starch-binding outer membrane protein SusC
MSKKHQNRLGVSIPMFMIAMLCSMASNAQNKVSSEVPRPSGIPSPAAKYSKRDSKSVGLPGSSGLGASGQYANGTIALDNDSLDKAVVDSQSSSLGQNNSISSDNQKFAIGYSSQVKRDFTGSIAIINVADLKSLPSANAESQMQGRASGVTVINDGRPGQGASVRIRGYSSFGGNEPLYVVDGVPSGGIRGLNPNDIESMQVLKDAASASIYGARAANGVVIITTKKGEQGRAKLTYNMYYGSQRAGEGYQLLNAQEYAGAVWNANLNAGILPSSPQYGSGTSPVIPDYILDGTEGGKQAGDVDESRYNLNMNDIDGSHLIHKANKNGTNWYNEIMNNAPIMNHSLTLSGGADWNRYLMSFDYFDQKSIMAFSFYKRYAIRFNTEFKINKSIRIGENLQISAVEDNVAGNNHEGTELGQAFRNQPIIPVFDIAGNFAGSRGPGLGNSANPYASRYRSRNNNAENMGLFGNLYIEVDFLKKFTARSSFGGAFTDGKYSYQGYKTYENSENYTTNSFTGELNNSKTWTWSNTVSYDNNFGKHVLKALAGTEVIEDRGNSIDGRRVGFFVDDVPFRSVNTGNGMLYPQSGSYGPSSLFSVFTQVNYSFADKYLAGLTVRGDRSSLFGSEHRMGVFPAVSAGWRIKGEEFMKNVKWITDLKLRASWGQMGNQHLLPSNGYDAFTGAIGSSGYYFNSALYSANQNFPQNITNYPEGKWETNTTTNLGLDAILFNGRTEVNLEWYTRKTSDLLLRFPYLTGIGTPSPITFYNGGSMMNSGLDLLINQKDLLGTGSKFKIDGTLTFTTFTNKVTKIDDGFDYYDTRDSRIGNMVRNQAGYSLSSYYGYKVIGLFQSESDVDKSAVQEGAGLGRFKFADINGRDANGNLTGNPDGKIDTDDKTILGDPHPDFSYGLQLRMQYGGFDASVFFYGVQGNDAFNYVKWWTDFFPSFQGNKSKDLLYNSWTPQNSSSEIPLNENVSNFSTNTQVNSYYIEDASYLRLKNLTVGYTLPSSLTNKYKISKFRIYIQATNLFTLSKYTGLNPEINGNDDGFGVDEGIFPTVKQFLFGINLGF